MNIAKQKEIMSLRKEVSSLEYEFREKQNAAVAERTECLIDSAFGKLKAFLEEQGFTVTFEEIPPTFTAQLDDIFIKIDKWVKHFIVHMPNKERYEVNIESDFSYSNPPYNGNDQDEEIEHLKRQINTWKELTQLIGKQNFLYVLNTYVKGTVGRSSDFGREKFSDFEPVLARMFS